MNNSDKTHLEAVAETYVKGIIDGRPPEIIDPKSPLIGWLVMMDENGNPIKKEDVKEELIEELSESEEISDDGVEAYYGDSNTLLGAIPSNLYMSKSQAMRTNGRRTLYQGPKGNIYPSPKRRK